MQAHGTGTPQNRVTESHIFNELAKTFGIEQWLTGAVKSYIGHSMAPAGGDQLSAILGTWNEGLVPGINTIDHIADDVHHSNLHLPMQHVELNPSDYPGAFVNSKGFGGNNATGLFLSPEQTLTMLRKRWGDAKVTAYQKANEQIEEAARNYDEQADNGSVLPIYKFGEGVLAGDEITFDTHTMSIPGFGQLIDLDLPNPYQDMTN